MTAWARRLALAVIRRLRRRLVPPRPPLPPGSVRHFVGEGGTYWRELTTEERAEMQATDPRPERRPRRWLDRPDVPRW